MKIIIITLGKSNPNRMNGVNKIVHQLATELTILKHDLEVWGISSSINRPGRQHNYKVKLFKKSIFNISIINEIRKTPLDTVFHFHGVLQPIFLCISLILKLYRKKWVITPHGAYLKQSLLVNYWVKKIYLCMIERFYTTHAMLIQSITLQEYNELPINLQKKSIIIPNACIKNNISIYQKNDADIIFGYIGRLDKNHKGLDLLIEGFNLFHKKTCRGNLWIIGDGPDRHYLENLVNQMGLTRMVTFFGECHGDVKHDHLQKMDIFIHCSRWDVLPTALLEAASYQIPMIVSQETGFGSFIKYHNAGIVLKDNTPTTISKGLCSMFDLHQENELKNLGINAKTMVKKEFNWNKIAPQIISDLYGIKIL